MNLLPKSEGRVFDRSPWGLVVVSGPDATSFLQAIVSQDLDPVAEGATVASLLLAPQGKLEVAFRATRRAGEQGVDGGDGGAEWWLDTDPAFGPHLAEGLGRYKIRVKVEINDRTAATGLASLVGGAVGSAVGSAVAAPDALVGIATEWGGAEGVDVLGPIAAVREWIAASAGGVGTLDEFEAMRIETGVPKLGVDVDDRTIPQEAFLEVDAVSFTKGCFIGQELVCRIDSRGHVNRFLRRLTLAGPTVPPAEAELVVGDKVVGQITSAAAVPGADRVVALAMVRREVEPPTDVTVRWPNHEVTAALLG